MHAPDQAAGPFPFRPASQIAARAVAWLWPGRLALGKLAILDGDPGLGKSLVTLDLCARLSTGGALPDGTPGAEPANVIVLNGEDGEEDTIGPRLQALGADLERVYLPPRERDQAGEPIRFPAQASILDAALTATRARLVVIDPIMAFLDPVILNSSDPSVRRALLPLARLADKHGCAILFVRHLNKCGGGRSVYRGGGSIAFLGACRSGWLIARDPHAPERCVLAQVKNNLAFAQASLAYRVRRPEAGTPTVVWEGPSPWTADELLANRPVATAPRRDRACEFLSALLAAGPQTSRDIWTAARQLDLSERTIERAKHDLAIRSIPVGIGATRISYWLLPGQQLPDPSPDHDAPADLEPWLAPLREQFPPATPLDDL